MGDTSYVMSTCPIIVYPAFLYDAARSCQETWEIIRAVPASHDTVAAAPGYVQTRPYVCSLPSEKVMPLGLSHGSGGVRGLVNLSWLRSAYSSRSFIASSRSSSDKAASQVSTQYITFAS